MATEAGKSGPAVTRFHWIALALVALTVLIGAARLLTEAGRPPARAGVAWLIHTVYRLQVPRAGVEVALAPPLDSAQVRLYSQTLTLDGLKFRLTREKPHGERRIITVARRPGAVGLQADFTVRLLPAAGQRQKTGLTPAERQLYLSREAGIDPDSSPVVHAVKQITAGRVSPEDLPGRVFQYLRAHVTFVATAAGLSGSEALRRGRGDDLALARAMVAVCRAEHLPARLVTGFILEERSVSRPQHWLQVYGGSRWVDYDPARGHAGILPPGYVAFSHTGSLLALDGARLVKASYELSRPNVAVNPAAAGRGNPLAVIDISRLPLVTRTTLATLLLLPLGALLNAFVRSVVGVRTYGTFTPALLALAAVYVAWSTAAIVFLVVAVFAFFGRFMLPGLKLSRAPRLTIVLTMVALSMSLAVSIMAYFGLLSDPHVVLLPIVILTALVDRIYTVVDEDGLRPALIRLAWTAVVAVGCFFILTQEALGELLVHYPELHFTTVALIIVLSRYNGPKLSRYPGLQWLTGHQHKAKGQAGDGAA